MKLFSGISIAFFGVTSLFGAPTERSHTVTPSEVSAQQVAVARHDGSRIFLRTAIFDPTTERPDFSAFSLGKGEESEYAVVQFRAGAAAAKEDLERRGVRFFGYLPDNAFQVRMSREARTALASHPSVRWIGDYEPGFKVQARLLPGSDDRTSEMTLLIFPDASAAKIATILKSEFPNAAQTHLLNDPVAPSLRFSVGLSERDDFVRRAARIASVSWIEPYDEPHFYNSNSSGPIQGGVAGAAGRTIFGRGITGTGQIIAVADSGLDSDMCFFRNLNGNNTVTDSTRTIAPALGPVFPAQKVFAYWVQEGADEYDTDAECRDVPTSFHGTHTAGSAAGDNAATPSSPTSGGVDAGDGMAPNAQILFQDIGANGGCLDGLRDPFNMFLQALDGGARIHSNSYGGDSAGAYSSFDQLVDRFLFDHDAMTIVIAAGNAGPRAGTTGSPGNAKNAVTVGALGNGMSNLPAGFSGRGLTADGRIKPDLQAPGSDIVSASGNRTHGDGNCSTHPLSGTSMSTPTVAGGAALMRQYFSDGLYPTGTANSADRFEARAPLIKAVLLNGTTPLPTGGTFGNDKYGWGRVFLDNNLFFPGDARKLRLWNLPNSEGLKTGQSHTYQIQVGAGQEFRATLVWSDPEGTPGAALSLVNNLDMTVTNDAGRFVANVFNAGGNSVPGGTADSRNNVEQVRFFAPTAGRYTIDVTGTNVPGNGRSFTNRQGYALAVSSSTCGTAVSAAPTGLVATSNARMGVDLSWVNPSGTSIVQIYRATGSCETATDYQYVGSSTGTTFTDVRAQGGQLYSYKLRGADGCGEGPVSGCLSITALGLCDLAPSFEGIATALADGISCRINLDWPAATSNCLLGQAVRYNIYRSTTPGFVPAGSPFATVTETSYSDTNVLSGTTYYYVVRAEDTVTGASGPNGGNEEINAFSLFATALGAPGELGTWTDDGGDTNAYLTPETPWQITATDAQAGMRSYHSAFDHADYTGDTCSALTSPSIVLGNGAQLSYWVRYNLEHQWDGVIVEISTDGGASWSDLPPTGGYPDTLAMTMTPPINACGYLLSHGAFTGPAENLALTPWTEYRSSLAAYNGQTVKIRWRLTTDPGLEFEGFNLDTIAITNVKLPSACIPTVSKPVAAFRLLGPPPVQGSPVAFRDISSAAPTSWLWSFGDGATSTQQHPTHVFATSGSFLVTLRASNAHGSTEISRSIIVGSAGVTRRRRPARS